MNGDGFFIFKQWMDRRIESFDFKNNITNTILVELCSFY